MRQNKELDRRHLAASVGTDLVSGLVVYELRPQIGASLLRQGLRLGPSPGRDILVMARAQDLGYRAILEGERAGVVGIFKQAILEALLDRKSVV